MDGNDNEIEWASNTSYLYANQSNTMVLTFNGTKIRNNLKNGPYYLKDLYIYHTGDPDKSVYLTNAYTTSSYSYADFEGTAVSAVGDANNDGSVNLIDLGMLGQAWGSSSGDSNYNANADFDNDGDVDLIDLGLLGQNWGNTY